MTDKEKITMAKNHNGQRKDTDSQNHDGQRKDPDGQARTVGKRMMARQGQQARGQQPGKDGRQEDNSQARMTGKITMAR